MDRLPPELLTHICSLACTDDGTTVKSLTLASGYLGEVCLPMQYQSLSIISHEDVASLGIKLSHQPEHLRRIFHLHLSLTFPDHRRLRKDFNDALRLLQLAAPSVETLAFTSPNLLATPTFISQLFRIPFPRLRELSIHGYYPLPSFNAIHMPRLEYLHFSGNRNPYGLLRTLKDCFPNITHLRISGLSMAVSFARELDGHMKAYRARSCVHLGDEDGLSLVPLGYLPRSSVPPSHLPSRLQSLVIQTENRPGRVISISNAKQDASMMAILSTCIEAHAEWIMSDGRGRGLGITLREGTSGLEEKMPCTTLYDDWLDRLMGGSGCW